MKNQKSLIRKAHFLGTKIRNLRKRNHLTMEDLTARCIKIDADSAPSVSYLSMIERGKRVPSEVMLGVIAKVFQKDARWFLDDIPEDEDVKPEKGSRGGIHGMALEPGFLFSKDILEIAIPEILAQTGTSGKQFAHIQIRAYQELHQNHFPDLERAAENIGNKKLPLTVDDLNMICRQLDLNIEWFSDSKTELDKDITSNLYTNDSSSIITSCYQPPGSIFLNTILEKRPERLKYDLAVHIGHCILHDKNTPRLLTSMGGSQSDALDDISETPSHSTVVSPKDILQAWRDFECTFFAGALLCPKIPFRQMLDRHSYEINVSELVGVSYSVVMRRMTAVSPYPYWHYFDALSPGKLKAVYRGNGIPLPWGNMRMVEDPCQHWAVFRMLNEPVQGTSSQLSIMNTGNEARIYCCESVNATDLAGYEHVLCAGIDLNPAIEAQGYDAANIANELKASCVSTGGSTDLPEKIKSELRSIAKILNIAWIERSLESPTRLICSRGATCPREPSCYP